jgi:hypothetical protein
MSELGASPYSAVTVAKGSFAAGIVSQ